MAFGAQPVDSANIPISSSYVPGTGFKAVQGGNVFTDASSNDSAPVRTEVVAASRITYAASNTGLALAAAPTNIATLTGSATKLVKLVKIGLTLSCTGLGVTSLDALLQKFSSALTGGTAVALTMVPMDANNAAATALAQNWTANSTGGGALVGNIRAQKIMPQWAGPAIATDFPEQAMPQVIWDFQGVEGPPTLRSASQVLSVNLNGGTLIATTTFAVYIVWTEE